MAAESGEGIVGREQTSLARDDERFMAAAIRLSRWHLGTTAENPSVGCLVVKDGVIVGSAVTAVGGRPHAEPQALADAGEKARGATVYVTLEPCSHHGRTPPCAEALIAAGVARVVVALTDPDPRVSGRGIALLEAAGIETVTGVCRELAEAQLEAYLTRQRKKRPQVILKLAVSADGMLGRQGEGQVAITAAGARAQSHILRAESDAILVGIGTAVADDPELTCRLPGMQARSPLRAVLDWKLNLPLSSKLVLGTAQGLPLVVFCDANADPARRSALETAGAEVVPVEEIGGLLDHLRSRGISALIVEGGARTAAAFLREGLVDRILLFTAHVVIGERGIVSPINEHTIPSGFRHRRSDWLGPDRMDDYIRDEPH